MTQADDTDLDVTSLRAAIALADRLVAHHKEGVDLATSLKRSLVIRLLNKQFPRLSLHDQEKLLRGYGFTR